MALGGIEYAEAEHALSTYLQTGTFFPAPAEIRALCRAPAAIGAGTNDGPKARMVYQVWSEAQDRYVRLPKPVPYDEELHGPKARMRRFAGEVLPGDPVAREVA